MLKKFVCLLMVAIMALSLSAVVFAANGEIQPLAECDHKGYPRDVSHSTSKSGCYVYTWEETYCSYCGGMISRKKIETAENHSPKAFYDTTEGWIVKCSKCGKKM